MDTISLEPKTKANLYFPKNSFFKKESYSDLDNFLKGTISGDELVQYICNRLDEKYSNN